MGEQGWSLWVALFLFIFLGHMDRDYYTNKGLHSENWLIPSGFDPVNASVNTECTTRQTDYS